MQFHSSFHQHLLSTLLWWHDPSHCLSFVHTLSSLAFLMSSLTSFSDTLILSSLNPSDDKFSTPSMDWLTMLSMACCLLLETRMCTDDAWCDSCTPSQSLKIQTHVKSPVLTLLSADSSTKIHVDIVRLLSASWGFSYLLTLVDHLTILPEGIPLTGITEIECARAFCHGWISCFGMLPTSPGNSGVATPSWLCFITTVFHSSLCT